MLNKEDKELLIDVERYFNVYLNIPKFVPMFFGFVFFILGIVGMNEGEGLLIWLGGALFCWLLRGCLKISCAKEILKVLYLKAICQNTSFWTGKEE